MGKEQDRDFRQLGLLLLVLITGLGLTFSATRESMRTSELQAVSSFRANAELYVDRVQGRLDAGLTAAQDLYDYYRESDSVPPETFALLTKTNSNLNNNRRFVSLAYALVGSDREEYLAGMNSLYGGAYQIKWPNSLEKEHDVAVLPEGENLREFPLLYTWAPEPARAQELLGLNIGALGQLNGYLEIALGLKEASAIFLPPFAELDNGQTGQVLLVNPFVSKGGNQGLIVQLVDFAGLVADVRAEIDEIGVGLDLTAKSSWGTHDHEAEAHDNGPDGNGHASGGHNGAIAPFVSEYRMGAGEWRFTVTPRAQAYPVDYGPAVITASVCLLLTGLFFFIVWSQLRRAKRVADIVSRRTRALKEAHDELEEHYKLLQNLNKDVEEARRSAELANRAKSEFLATMSHELRTPLNAILGFSQLLSEQALGPIGDNRYIEYSKDIHSSGSHLLSLINDILDLAKLEAGKISIEKNALSTQLLTERVITLLSQQADNKGVELYAEFDDNMPDRILGDELRLRQILINLCSNAIKFTHEGSVVARLFAKPFQNGRQGWVLEVQDTGIGIPEEKQATLFDRFTQVDAALSRRHGGVGLGLAICRELVDRMEGRISVRSMVNVGTAIRVHLPLEEASPDDIDDDMMI